MRFSVVIRYIGMVLLVLAAFMLVSAGISYDNANSHPYNFLGALVTV